MNLKSDFKPACKKIWKAFNSWRKRGMWFRVTVLLIIGFSMNCERMYTTDHVPLINELVLIACKAIRMGSEPKVTSAHLRYLHVQKSRQLQNQLRKKVKDGSLRLNSDETKLLHQNTRNANYNKLFKLAKSKKLIPDSVTLAQTKRAMLDKSLKLTAERFDSEWADVKRRVLAQPPFSIRQNLQWFWYSFVLVLPLPLITVIPWFILCLTLGYWGAMSKYKAKWIIAVILATTMTFLSSKIIENAILYGYWKTIGICTYWTVFVFIASLFGKRLYNYVSTKNKEVKVLIYALLISGIILLTPAIWFEKDFYIGFHYCCAQLGNYLLFRNSVFAPYFITAGVGVLFYTLFFVFKTYDQKLKSFKWAVPVKYLVIVLLLAKLLYSWYPLLSKYF